MVHRKKNKKKPVKKTGKKKVTAKKTAPKKSSAKKATESILYKDLVESANDIIFNIDSSGYFTYMNPVFYKLTGYKNKEVIGKHFTTFIERGYKTRLFLFYSKQIKKKIKSTYIEFPVVKKNKELLWVGQSVKLLLEKNKVKGLVSIARDITERLELEEKNKTSNLRLRALIENLQSGILVEDENRKIILVNEHFCSMFHIPAEPSVLVGADCSQSAQQAKHLFKDEEKFVSDIDKILENKKPALNELIYLKSGQIFKRDYIPVFHNNKYMGHLWKYSDITVSRNTQDAIKKNEEKYLGIINNMELGLIEVDREEIILNANERFCDMTGYTHDELVGKNASELLLLKKHAHIMADQSKKRKEGKSSVYEVEIARKNGDTMWLLISGAPVFNDSGENLGSIGIHLDITPQKRIEVALEEAKEKAEQSSKAKEIFMANVSHEIRTPLNAILGMTDLMKESALTDKQKQYLEAIHTSSGNLLTIINDILDFSKIRSGHFTLTKEPISFKKVIEESMSSMRFVAEQKNLKLTTEIAADLPECVFGDAGRINQVLLNLLSNAVKFTPRGSIIVKADCEHTGENTCLISLRVSDTGVGISKDKIEKIFEVFSQEDESVSRNFGGTGLGLSITKQLIELMGGKITVESKKDIGTEFLCTIPFQICTATDVSAQNHGIDIDYGKLKNKKVLLAEDNELNETIATEILSSLGMQTVIATNGKEAIDILKENSFDVILMDIQMPVMDGLRATEIILHDLKLDTPIIALTANALKEDKTKFLSKGMKGYLSKPFDKIKLYQTLLSVIDKPIAEENTEYNLNKLHSLGGSDFVDKMKKLFLSQTPELLTRLQTALSENNFLLISETAHQLKPSLDLFGIEKVKPAIHRLENTTKEKFSKTEALNDVQLLKSVLEKVFNDLRLLS